MRVVILLLRVFFSYYIWLPSGVISYHLTRLIWRTPQQVLLVVLHQRQASNYTAAYIRSSIAINGSILLAIIFIGRHISAPTDSSPVNQISP